MASYPSQADSGRASYVNAEASLEVEVVFSILNSGVVNPISLIGQPTKVSPPCTLQ